MREIPPIKKLIVPSLFIIGLFIAQLYMSPERVPLWRFQGEIMGTTYTVQVIDPTTPDGDAIHATLEAVNQRMSTYLKTSELSLLNASSSKTAIELSAPLRLVLTASLEISEATSGAFDVTVGPLVNAWGFGPDGRRSTPSTEERASLMERVGYTLLKISQDGVSKERSDLYIDLSAIAKGYAVDQVAETLDQAGYHRYWVEVGGEVRGRGLNSAQRPWRAGIEKPLGDGKRGIHRILSLRDISVATSGDYRNRYTDDRGVSRSHTIDPRTGAPITHLLASVSVLHPQNMYADAWATALNVLGPKEGLAVANAHKIKALFLTRTPETQALQELHSDELTIYLDQDQSEGD